VVWAFSQLLAPSVRIFSIPISLEDSQSRGNFDTDISAATTELGAVAHYNQADESIRMASKDLVNPKFIYRQRSIAI